MRYSAAMAFANDIIHWYEAHGRDLPWRNTSDPYHIWLSEIILQQTRVEQGMSYYLRFVKEFPTVNDLAHSTEERVLKCWQGLGYYSRARNLHAAAQHIAFDLSGQFPNTYDDILSLRGVGPYTAAAIASFAFGLPYPVIDGNVFRVVSRLHGIDLPIDSTKARPYFLQVLNKMIDRDRPAAFNQALMDFGALVCKPQAADCKSCIFADRCVAWRTGRVALLPVKGGRPAVSNRYFYYFVFVIRRSRKSFPIYTVMQCRKQQDIWKGLYEFPLLEPPNVLVADDLLNTATTHVQKLWPMMREVRPSIVGTDVHKLSHQTIHATFLRVEAIIDDDVQIDGLVELAKVDALPVSRLTDRFLATFSFGDTNGLVKCK